MSDIRKIRVLVVDDDDHWLQVICDYLVKEEFEVRRSKTGREAVEFLKNNQDTDMILLDWMMPGMNGLDVCREIRKFSDVPIIFLTAKSEETDRIIGLELGADDYLTKPFSMREMVTRIRVVLRRFNRPTKIEQDHESELLKRGPLIIDITGHKVWIHEQEVSLTPTEFKLLSTLAKHPGRTYSRLQLLETALGEEYAGYERTIDAHIHNLRKKIESDPSRPRFIKTVFGVGYKFGENQ